MSVIGIAGRARSGKETAAEYISEYLESQGVQTRIYRFADPLKTFLARIFGWSDEELYGSLKDRTLNCKLHMDIVECVIADFFRDFLDNRSDLKQAVQYFKETLSTFFCVDGSWLSPIVSFQGSARRCLQILGTDWAQEVFGEDVWIAFADKAVRDNPDKVILVPDVRFPKEVAWCQNLGILVNIQRDTSGYNVFSDHASESLFDSFAGNADDVIMNYGSLGDLREECYGVGFSFQCGAYGVTGCGK